MKRAERWAAPMRLILALLMAWAGLMATMGLVPHAGPNEAQAAGPPLTTTPSDFQDTIAFRDLDLPTSVRFAPDGRIFVTEKKGVIKVFADLYADTPMLTIDLQTNVNSYWDHGLSGLALDPQFPTVPDLYVTYTYDAPLGGTAPVWNDECTLNLPPGCPTSGRLSRFHLTSPTTAGPEEVLVADWCQQGVTHSIDDVAFGPDGKLYVSAGEGANHFVLDIGESNVCNDPPREGGALRAQDIRTTGDPLGYGGTILRVNPANPSDRQVVGYGLRNPYRMTFRLGSNQLWVADVGNGGWEELNWIDNALGGAQPNFGWPCYEGFVHEAGFDSLNLPLCESLYSDPNGGYTPGAQVPYYAYQHNQIVSPNDGCRMDPAPPQYATSAVTGVAFYPNSGDGNYPAQYHGALFFADFARGCIWTMAKDGYGNPDPFTISPFVVGGIYPVDLQIGPGGDIFYVDIFNGTVHRVRYRAPVADIQASPTSGNAPLTVNLNGSVSTVPSGLTLSYSWDLDGNGTFGDATTATVQRTYGNGVNVVRLRVTASNGVFDIATVRINVGNTPPTATINSPGGGLTWRVGDTITFSGSATDPQQGTLPASAFTWTLIMHHCPSGGCHQHVIQSFTGVASGSFVAPDHEYPSYLELRLTVRDAGNLTDMKSLLLYPRTVDLSFTSDPSGNTVLLNGAGGATPRTSTVIMGSGNTISVGQPAGDQIFVGWTVNGTTEGWAQPLHVTADEAKTIGATFATPPTYNDLPTGHPASEAVRQLSARGLIKGYTNGNFGPEDNLLRAQIAALIVRAMGWSGEQANNPFTDGTGISPELWKAVAILAERNIAHGYTATTYGPNDFVLQAQAISLITRTMVAQGYWQYQPDDPSLYTAVPASAGHRIDLATFVHYAGALPDVPADQSFATWNQPANRGWFARALWQALDSYFGR
ncbi:MAG: PQQ-dependent sugar dehydrogenase [Thermomicrobiales bacterium]